MHWFGRGSLDVFLRGHVRRVRRSTGPGESSLYVSLRTLPDRPTVIVLEPRYLDLQ